MKCLINCWWVWGLGCLMTTALLLGGVLSGEIYLLEHALWYGLVATVLWVLFLPTFIAKIVLTFRPKP